MRALLTQTPPLTILASATLTASEAEYMLPNRHAVFETGTKAGRPAVRVEATGDFVQTVAGGKVAKKMAKQRVVNIGPDDDAPTNRFKCGKADLDTRTVEELGLDTCAMLYAGVAYIDSRETG